MTILLISVSIILLWILFSVAVPLCNYIFSLESFGVFQPVYDVLAFLFWSDWFNALMSIVVLCIVWSIFHWCLNFIKQF